MLVLSRRSFLTAVSATVAYALPATAADQCPGVDPSTGKRPDLSPTGVVPNMPKSRPIPTEWRQVALEVIALFESGRRNVADAYANVSATDVMSLGYLQWNHNAGSLYDTLLAGGGEEFAMAAPTAIRPGVNRLLKVAAGSLSRDDGLEVLEGWRKSGSIKPAVRPHLVSWLTSQPLRARQDKLIDVQLSRALMLTDAWQRDLGLSIEGNAPKRAFYSFADLQVFNGGELAGLWVDHVKSFRKEFATGIAMMDHIAEWVQACQDFDFTGKVLAKDGDFVPRYTKLYRRKETSIAVREWRRLAAAGDRRVNEDALNLIALGFLRARISTGTEKPNGFHGVFQLDVLNRRGMMATGIGVQNGEEKPQVLFSI